MNAAAVQEVVEFLKNPGKFTALGGKLPRGLLLLSTVSPLPGALFLDSEI